MADRNKNPAEDIVPEVLQKPEVVIPDAVLTDPEPVSIDADIPNPEKNKPNDVILDPGPEGPVESPADEDQNTEDNSKSADDEPANNADEEPTKKNDETPRKKGETYDQSMNNLLETLTKAQDHMEDLKSSLIKTLGNTKTGQAVIEKVKNLQDALGERSEDIQRKLGQKWDEHTKEFIDENKAKISSLINDAHKAIANTEVGKALGNAADKVSKFNLAEDFIRPSPRPPLGKPPSTPSADGAKNTILASAQQEANNHTSSNFNRDQTLDHTANPDQNNGLGNR